MSSQQDEERNKNSDEGSSFPVEASMKPLPVYTHKDGSHVLVGWACSHCGRVTLEKGLDPKLGASSWSWVTARDHCNVKCRQCGTRVEKGRKLCVRCTADDALKRETDQYERGQKVSINQWDGPLYLRDTDQYFESATALEQWCEENDLHPHHAHACKARPINLDVTEVLKDTFSVSAVEQIGDVALKLLQGMFDRWASNKRIYIPSDEVFIVMEGHERRSPTEEDQGASPASEVVSGDDSAGGGMEGA